MGFKVEHLDNMLDQVRLDLAIYVVINRHGWTGVDLYQPGLLILIHHDVKAKQLETTV